MKCADWITYLQLFNIDTGVIGETFCICDLNVSFLQLISQVVPHLLAEERERKRKNMSTGDDV